jgi:recombinase
MPPSQRVTIRLPSELLATLEASLRPGETLSDIVRQALNDYVRRVSDTAPPRTSDAVSDTVSDDVSDTSNPGDIRVWMTQITRQIATLSDTVRQLVVSQVVAPQAPPPDPLLLQIQHWQAEGMTLRAIAAKLNADGVPTRSGQGQWYQSNLSRELRRAGR